MLDIHGTDDPCWVYDGGPPTCPIGTSQGDFVSKQQTLDAWAQALGCSGETTTEELPDTSDDGTTSQRIAYQRCAALLEHIRIEGGGHTWPDGYAYLSESIVGRVPRDWGNEVLWDFFEANGRLDLPTQR